MRISDWSSDVCSSDLAVQRNLVGAMALAAATHQRFVIAREQSLDAAVAKHRHRLQLRLDHGAQGRVVARPQGPERGAEGPPVELGRASWRERVCQYV